MHDKAMTPGKLTLAFLLLTFLWSWACWALAIASGQEWTEFPAAGLYALGGIGPSLAAMLLVYSGRAEETPSHF